MSSPALRRVLNFQNNVTPRRYDVSETKDYSIVVNGTQYEVLNYSSFGIAISVPHDAMFHGNSNFKAQFFIRDTFVQEIDMRWIRSQEISNKVTKMAFEVRGEPIAVQKSLAMYEALSLLKKHQERHDYSNEIYSQFKAAVQNIYDELCYFKRDLEELEKSWASYADDVKQCRAKGVAQVVAKYLATHLKKYHETLYTIVAPLEEKSKQLHFRYFKDTIFPLISSVPFVHRLVFKPLGQAGDYETVNQMFENSAEGVTLFEKTLHAFYLQQMNATSVNERNDFILQFINKEIDKNKHKGKMQILSIECGPALEVQKFIEQNKETEKEISFVLYDQDVRALQHAQYHIRESLLRSEIENLKFSYQHNSIKLILARGIETRLNSDFVYTLGGLDNLGDEAATAFIQQIHKNLTPGGVCVISAFSPSPEIRFQMELMGWNCHFRSAESLLRLGKSVTPHVRVEGENNSHLFLVIESA